MAFAAKQEPNPDVIEHWHRVIPPDFDRLGMWLIGRLAKHYSHVSERQILSWLRGVMESSSYLFISNGSAVLLARMGPKEMDTAPSVSEVFCLCQDGGFKSGAVLYPELMRWGASLGAVEIGLMNFSDVPRPMVEEAIGEKIRNRSMQYAPVVR